MPPPTDNAAQQAANQQLRGLENQGATQVPLAANPAYASGTGGDKYIRNVLGGQYLEEGNPYLDRYLADARAQLQQQSQQQMGQLNSQSLRPSRLGSTYYQQQAQNVGQQFADASASAENASRMQVYNTERGHQQQAAGLSNQRDAAIWGDQTTRIGQDKQLGAAQASAGASIAASRLNAENAWRMKQADQAWRQAQLQEGARQYDASLPLQYGQLLSSTLGDFSRSQQADTGQMAGLLGQQYGQQAGATAGYGQMLGQQGSQGMQAAGMYGDMGQSNLPWAQAAAGMYGQLDATQAQRQAASAAAAQARAQLGFAQQQTQYQSILGQQASQDPWSQLQQLLPFLGTIGGLAGGQTHQWGTNAGANVPVPSVGAAGLTGGLGGAMAGYGMMQGSGVPWWGGGGGGGGGSYIPPMAPPGYGPQAGGV